MLYHIYALQDPRCKRYFYVGQTKYPEYRYRQHMSLKDKCNERKNAWIEEIQGEGLQPQMVILAKVSAAEVYDREHWYIWYGLASGWPLTNISGVYGHHQGSVLAIGAEFLFFKRWLIQYYCDLHRHRIGLETFTRFVDAYKINQVKRDYLCQLAQHVFEDYYMDKSKNSFKDYISARMELLLATEETMIIL